MTVRPRHLVIPVLLAAGIAALILPAAAAPDRKPVGPTQTKHTPGKKAAKLSSSSQTGVNSNSSNSNTKTQQPKTASGQTPSPNPSSSKFSLSIVPLGSPINWTGAGQSIVTSVTVGEATVTNLRVNVALTDEATARQFGGADFVAYSQSEDHPDPRDTAAPASTACANQPPPAPAAPASTADNASKDEQKPGTPITCLNPKQTLRLYLRPRDDRGSTGAVIDTLLQYLYPPRRDGRDTLAPGKYVGTIQLVSDQGESDAEKLTINVTLLWAKAIGIFLVVAGVVLSWVMTVCVRNRMARLKMLQKIAEVDASLVNSRNISQTYTRKLTKEFEGSHTQKLIDEVRNRYRGDKQPKDKISYFRNLLPKLVSREVDDTGFKDRIKVMEDWAQILADIASGFSQVWRLDGDQKEEALKAGANPDPNPNAAAIVARQEIDDISSDLYIKFVVKDECSPATVRTWIDTRITAAINAAAAAMKLDKPNPAGNNSKSLDTQVDILNMLSWVVAMLLTVLAGTYVMVISHNDFGRWTDYWLCFLWGLGLPTASKLGPTTLSAIVADFKMTPAK